MLNYICITWDCLSFCFVNLSLLILHPFLKGHAVTTAAKIFFSPLLKVFVKGTSQIVCTVQQSVELRVIAHPRKANGSFNPVQWLPLSIVPLIYCRSLKLCRFYIL